VDYFHPRAVSNRYGFGFYLRADAPIAAPYSHNAKRHLYTGLMAIEELLGMENLFAVYLDVGQPVGSRPAYDHLKQDLRARLFRSIFVVDRRDLFFTPEETRELACLNQEVGGLELISFDVVEKRLEVASLLVFLQHEMAGLCV
jgi:hypothetical protein